MDGPDPPEKRVTKRGFASMSPERRSEIARMGGASIPPDRRAFSTNRLLAQEAGRKGSMTRPGKPKGDT